MTSGSFASSAASRSAMSLRRRVRPAASARFSMSSKVSPEAGPARDTISS
jgi:hypothetical protein